MTKTNLLNTLLLSALLVMGTLIAFFANALSVPEGAVVKTANNPDVYIIKYKNGKQFKRLVLNPQVFESYGHLRWENILTIDQTTMNSYITSNLVRVDGQTNVYQLIANGDTGSKYYMSSLNGLDPDSIYTINNIDFGNYISSEASFKDGNYIVGIDIQPGTYRTREKSSGCYYARLSGFGGSLSEIIANNNTDNPAIITILPTDKGFSSVRCGIWTQELSPITSNQTSFGDGMFIVGTDIQSGTYRNTGGNSCYYSKLRGFSETFSDIISNGNTDTSTVVTILESDKGFESVRCGIWSKIE